MGASTLAPSPWAVIVWCEAWKLPGRAWPSRSSQALIIGKLCVSWDTFALPKVSAWVDFITVIGLYKALFSNNGKSVRRCLYICKYSFTFCSKISIQLIFKHLWLWVGPQGLLKERQRGSSQGKQVEPHKLVQGQKQPPRKCFLIRSNFHIIPDLSSNHGWLLRRGGCKKMKPPPHRFHGRQIPWCQQWQAEVSAQAWEAVKAQTPMARVSGTFSGYLRHQRVSHWIWRCWWPR